MRIALSMAVLVCCCSPLLAADKEKSLKYLYTRSEVVLAGEVGSEPVASLFPGGVRYTFTVRLSELLRYRLLEDRHVEYSQPLVEGQEYPLEIARFDQDSTAIPPFLRKGSKCVFFLRCKVRKEPYPLVVPGDLSDAWLGVQPSSRLLVRRLIAFGEAEKQRFQK